MQGLTVRWTRLGGDKASGFRKPTVLQRRSPCDQYEASGTEGPKVGLSTASTLDTWAGAQRSRPATVREL